MKTEYIISIVCVSWIIVDAIIADTLFEANHTLTKWLQGGIQNTSSPRFMSFQIITQFGYAHIVGVLIGAGFLFFANKIQALKVLLYTLITSYSLSVLKLLYHEPRPYFAYSDLHGIGCDTEYGKPSGHAMVTLVLYYILFDSFVNGKFFDFTNSINYVSGKRDSGNIELVEVVIIKQDQQGHEIIQNDIQKEDKFVNNKFYFSFYVIWIFLIGFSRVILGAHSFSQVSLGWCYGSIFVILYRLKLEKVLEDALLTATHKGFTSQKHFNTYVVYSVLLYVALIALNLVTYYIVDNSTSQEDKNKYANNIMSKPYCRNTFKPDNYKFLADKCMLDSITITVTFGIFITIVFTKGRYNPERWSENYRKLPLLYKVLRIIVIGLICGIPFGMTQFLHFPNIYLHYFFKASLQAFLVSFALIKVSPWVIKFFKMDVEGDFLQASSEQSFFDSSFNEKDFVKCYHK